MQIIKKLEGVKLIGKEVQKTINGGLSACLTACFSDTNYKPYCVSCCKVNDYC